MPLWGNSDAVEAKPKHLTDAEKLNVYATEKGWVKKVTGTGGRAGRIQEEVLVAIGELSTSLNLADITAIDFDIDSLLNLSLFLNTKNPTTPTSVDASFINLLFSNFHRHLNVLDNPTSKSLLKSNSGVSSKNKSAHVNINGSSSGIESITFASPPAVPCSVVWQTVKLYLQKLERYASNTSAL